MKRAIEEGDGTKKRTKTKKKKVSDLDPAAAAVTAVAAALPESKISISSGGCYCIARGEQRFGLLATFLKKNLRKKVVVVFSTYRSLLFHGEVFVALGIPNLSIHEKSDDAKASSTIEQFRDADRALLLTTDAALDGLVIPPVDWILQFEPPHDVEKYKQRRGHQQGCNNRGLLFLLPHEIEIVKDGQGKDSLAQCEFSDTKTANLQSQMAKLVQKNFRIHQLSLDAYRSYLQDYASNPHKSIFNVRKLDPQASAASFGIKRPPKIAIS